MEKRSSTTQTDVRCWIFSFWYLLWTFFIETAACCLKTIYIAPVTALLQRIAEAGLKKRPTHNSIWVLFVLSLYNFYSNSEAETLTTTMTPGWVTPSKIDLSRSSQAGYRSHFSVPDNLKFAASGLTEQTVHCWGQHQGRGLSSLSTQHLSYSTTQAITWPLQSGRNTYLLCLRCNHNQVTQHRLLCSCSSN